MLLRATVRSSCQSFTVVSLPGREGPETASEMVNLKFEIMFFSQTRGEGGREEGSSEPAPAVHLRSLTSSFVVNRSSLENRQQVADQIRQYLSNFQCERLLLEVDEISTNLFDLVQQRTRPTTLRPEESLVIVSTTTVTYHFESLEEYWPEDVNDDLVGSNENIEEYLEEMALAENDQSAISDSLSAYEPLQVPASRASVDALERKKVEEQEEGAPNTCVVCQDEIGRGDTMAKMPCSHEFHEGCILEWLSRAHSCPVCRFELLID